jgi:5-methylcytosine-specific restriction endonuclease McrA
VLARDHYTCQYCQCQPGRGNLTIDHVLPRSRGGETRWENLVTACAACNRRKGDRTPAEAKMPLRREPRRPRYLALTLLEEARAPEEWNKYMYF